MDPAAHLGEVLTGLTFEEKSRGQCVEGVRASIDRFRRQLVYDAREGVLRLELLPLALGVRHVREAYSRARAAVCATAHIAGRVALAQP